MKEFVIYVKDKPGALSYISGVLGKSAVNIEAMSAEPVLDQIKLVTNDENSTRNALASARLKYDESDILVMTVINRPGEIHKAARKLAEKGINIESFYLLDKHNGHQDFALKASDMDGAARVLRASA